MSGVVDTLKALKFVLALLLLLPFSQAAKADLCIDSTTGRYVTCSSATGPTGTSGSLLFGASTGMRFVSSGGFQTAGIFTSANALTFASDTSSGAQQSVFSYPLDTTDPTLSIFRHTQWNLNETYSTTLTPKLKELFAITGSVTSGSGFLNQISLSSDNATTVAGSGPGTINMLYLSDGIGGGVMTGHRTGLTTQMRINSATGNTSGIFYYVGANPQCIALSDDNGVNGSPLGNCFGSNPIVHMFSGATYWQSVVGEEIDVEADAGSSMTWKEGLKIGTIGSDAVQGTNEDAALVFFASSSSLTSAWGTLIQIGTPTAGFPVYNGCIMCSASTLQGSNAYTVAHGIDFVDNAVITCTSDCFKSTGFTVNGAGSWISNARLLISTTAPAIASGFNTASNSITGTNTGAFQVTVGTSTATTTGVVTMPTATTGWACSAADVTTPATHMIQQTGSTTTSVTVTDYARTTGVAQNMANSDKIVFNCGAF